MKRVILILLIIVFFPHIPHGDQFSLIQVQATVVPRRLARGQEGKIELRVRVKEGITISPLPAFTIELSPSDELAFPKDFFTASDLEIEILEEEGKEFLNLKEPVAIPFTVKLEASRGSHMIQGRVKYFGCSLDEGWCLKESTKFSTSFYTSNRIYKK